MRSFTLWQFGHTIHRRLLMLAMALLVPLAVFGFVLALRFAQTERARSEAQALELADRASAVIDQEISSALAMLQGVAGSTRLIDGEQVNMRHFQARLALAAHGLGRAVILRDRSGVELMNTEAAPGANPTTERDPALRAADRTVFETHTTVVTDLITNGAGQKVISVEVPVSDADQVAYVLTLEIEPAMFSQLVGRITPPGWRIAIVDGNGRLLSRFPFEPDLIGKEAAIDFAVHATGASGAWVGKDLTGTDVLAAFVRSATTGWRVAGVVPAEAIERPVTRLILLFVVSGTTTIVLAAALALLMARTISRPVTALTQAASALGRGEPVSPLRTGLEEADAVGAALAQAGQSIRSREAALLSSELRFRAAVQAVQGVVWTNDAQGRMVGEQPGWAALTGQTQAEYQGYGWADAVHPDDVAPTIAAWETAVREHKPFVFEHRVRRHDGVYRHFAIRATPVAGLGGEVLSWVGVHTDRTDEIEAQRRLAEQEARLREANENLERRVARTSEERDRIWRISTELMVVAHLDGAIVSANPACTRTLGWSEGELRQRSLVELVHPDDRAALHAQLAQLAQGVAQLGVQNRYRCQGGQYRWLSWTAVADDEMVYGIARDVTVEHEAAEALRRTEEQLRQSQKMEVVGQLTGGIAHDFNNLLTVVSGNLEMAKRRLETDGDVPRLQRNLSAALEGSRRAANLTHRLLAFSRRSELQPEVLSLNDVLGGMADLIRRTADERIAIETDLEQALWSVEADQNQLENAILNLCVNARDAMPNGGKLRLQTQNLMLGPYAPQVRRGALPMGDYAALRVSDNGTGIAPEMLDRVFEPFFTTKPIGKGTGLGLSQVFGFMSQSAGLAEIESELGRGTTVTLLLPRTQRAAEADGRVEPAGTRRRTDFRGHTCLIIEDDAMVREFAVTALEEVKFTVHQAEDAASALALLQRHPEIELLFTDIVLSGGSDGRQLAAAARRMHPGLKVLYTSGYGHMLDKAAPGQENFLTKPFTASALVARVDELLAPETVANA